MVALNRQTRPPLDLPVHRREEGERLAADHVVAVLDADLAEAEDAGRLRRQGRPAGQGQGENQGPSPHATAP
jgi:hypothetical protein